MDATQPVLVQDAKALLQSLEAAAKQQLLSYISLREAILQVRRSQGSEALKGADYYAAYTTGPPAVLAVRIPGPVLSLNIDLHGYVPLDRVVYNSNREWWRQELATALATIPESERRTFERAGIIVTETSCDLDNIGIKTLIDGLCDLKVVKDDSIDEIPFLLVKRAVKAKASVEVMVVDADAVYQELESIYSGLALCLQLPDDTIIASQEDNPFVF